VLLSKPAYRFLKWAALIAVLLGFALTAPSSTRWGLNPIDEGDVLVYQADPQGLSRATASARDTVALSDYEVGDVPAPVQFHIPPSIVRQDRYFFVANISEPLRMFVGGSLTGAYSDQGYEGIGLSRHFMLGPQSEILARPDSLRVDLVGANLTGQPTASAFFFGDEADSARTLSAYTEWSAQLRMANALAAMLALACGIAGLLFGKARYRYIAGVIVGSTFAMIAAPGWLPIVPVAPAWVLSAGLILSGIVFLYSERAAAPGSMDRYNLVLAGLAILGGAAGLMLTQLDRFGLDFFTVRHLINLAAVPMALIGLPRALAGDVRDLLVRLEQSRRDLGLKDEIIEQQEQQMQDQIRKQAILEERQRFVRDMHDGVGGNLLSLLMRVRTKRVDLEKVELELEDGLTDLRLVVDSLDQTGATLVQALAMFKSRAERQLDAVNVAMEWSQEGDIGARQFDSRAILSIYRIMQEATTNALRHAGPKTVHFSTHYRDATGEITVQICDDGAGFDETAIKAGRGLANMRQRAAQLGGEISIAGASGGDTGTCVTLKITGPAPAAS
jgi:signal transduction histidine kinase